MKEGFTLGAQDIINFCRDNLPHYMAPRTVIFEDIPKTATSEIQKFIPREKANALGSLFQARMTTAISMFPNKIMNWEDVWSSYNIDLFLE